MHVFAIILFVLLVVIDQATKYMATIYLEQIGSVSVIENLLHLTFVQNTGAAFGILQGGRIIFLIITPIILIGLIVYYLKLPKERVYNFVRFALVLILSGAVGNYIDRFRLAYVVDFFEVKFITFPVFNMADIYVVTGTVLMSVLLIFFIKEEKS